MREKQTDSTNHVDAHIRAVYLLYLEKFPWWLPEELEPEEGKAYIEPAGRGMAKHKEERCYLIQQVCFSSVRIVAITDDVYWH